MQVNAGNYFTEQNMTADFDHLTLLNMATNTDHRPYHHHHFALRYMKGSIYPQFTAPNFAENAPFHSLQPNTKINLDFFNICGSVHNHFIN